MAALAGDEGLERTSSFCCENISSILYLSSLSNVDRGDRVEETGLEVRAVTDGGSDPRDKISSSVGSETKVKAREHRPLGVQKGGESLLAQLELLGEHR